MLPRIDSTTTDVLAIPPRARLGAFATPPHSGINPPQPIPTQIQTQRTQTQSPPLTLTTSHTEPSSTSTSRPIASEPSFRLQKQGVEPANIYDHRHPPPSVFSANINFSPTSTAGSSGAPPSMGRTTTTTTTASKNPNEMEDEPRDFAELPKTSPHFNTHLLLPFPGAARQHASTAGPGQEEQDPFHASKVSFAPIFAPVEVVPYGADRVLFVEGLIWTCVGKIEQLYGPQDTIPPFNCSVYGGSIEDLVHKAVLHSLSGESALVPIMHVIQNPPVTHQTSDSSPDPQPSTLIPLPLFLLEMLRRMRTSAFLLLTAMRWVSDLGEKGVIDGVREKMSCAACKSHFQGCRHMPDHLAFLEPEQVSSNNRYTRMGRVPPGKKERPSKKKHLQDGKTITLEEEEVQRQQERQQQEKKPRVPVVEKIRDGSEEFTSLEGFALASLEDPKKTVLGALVMAAKWHRDKTVGDKVWGSIVGLTTEEVGRAERAVAIGLSWEMGRGWVSRSGCGISWVFLGLGGNDDGGEPDPGKRRKGRRSKKQIDKERLEREGHVRRMVLEVLDIQALFPTSEGVEQLRRSDANALVAGSVHPSWSEALCALSTADRVRYGVQQLRQAGIHPGPIYKASQRPIPVHDTRPRRVGVPGVDWEAMEILFGLRQPAPTMQEAPLMQIDDLEAADTTTHSYSTVRTGEFANLAQSFITDGPMPTVGRKIKREGRGEWEDETELMQPHSKKRQLVKQPAFSTEFAPFINANYSVPKTIDPLALQQALKAVPQTGHTQLLHSHSYYPNLTSAGASDAESTPELLSDDGMSSVISSRNPSIISVHNEPTCVGIQTKGPMSMNFHSGSAASSWADERDQVAIGIDAYRLHSKAYPPARAWSLDASAFTLVQ